MRNAGRPVRVVTGIDAETCPGCGKNSVTMFPDVVDGYHTWCLIICDICRCEGYEIYYAGKLRWVVACSDEEPIVRKKNNKKKVNWDPVAQEWWEEPHGF